MKEKYIVVFEDEIIGQFSQLENAKLLQYITALHAGNGDKVYLYEILTTIEVAE